ncbi:MAG: M20/M25/M40 family metallo-hydrolase [Desulfobacterales bacterium]|nr:M20/M25/M40 family metallo-hydrolase [Desulfobacterales bacterium]
MELIEILEKMSVPRPNHSEEVAQTAAFIQGLLSSWGIPFTVQEFPLRYHAMLLQGIAIILLAVIFAYFIVKKRPVLALVAFMAIPAIIILENEFHIYVVSPLLQKTGENIVMSFKAPDAVRELIFAAHYDSKTDVWDHIERAKILTLFPYALLLGLLISVWTFITNRFSGLDRKPLRATALCLTALLVIYCGFAFSWLGGYIFLGNERESFGAIDDGGSVVSLLALARDIREGRVKQGKSDITILLTGAEEVGLQGAHSYVLKRFGNPGEKTPDPPAYLINLELVAQNGNMVHWQKVGSLFTHYPADAGLVKRMDMVWKGISGRSMDVEERLSDDSFMFGRAGIPFITVGHTGLPGPGLGGFHSPQDSMERVNPENLHLMVKTLEKFIDSY